MSKINVLPKEVFNRISAGEVVERPSSVVKELFENSVDSGARAITVAIENGGTEEIHIQDDGCGMSPEDLKKAFLPHATSKIKVASDLDFIETLGFRGEALASIGAVSYSKIVSKTKDSDNAYQITCEGGVIGEVHDSVGVEGTSIIVNSLFYNTPARLKFLKTAKGEEREISSLVDKLILANPYVAVKYYVEGRLLRESYGDGLKDAVRAVYGKEALDNCYEISTEKNGLFIRGYIGSANYYKGNRTYQTIIVNGRYVTDNTISMAIQNAYSNYLMKRQYPFYVLNISVDPSVVDVNVHPRKAEIRFANNQIIYGTVYSVISKVLDGSSQALSIVDSAPFISQTKEELKAKPAFTLVSTESPVEVPPLELGNADAYDLDNLTYNEANYKGNYDLKPLKRGKKTPFCDVIRDRVTDFTDEKVLHPENFETADDVFEANKKYIEKLEAERNSVQQELDQDLPVRYIGQALSTYVIHECGDELIIIDQHAAHERILFDNLYNQVKTREVASQPLLVPYTFNTNDTEAGIIYEMLDLFREVGFDIELLKENTFRVYGVPLELVGMDLNGFFRDILTDDRFKDEKIPTVIRESIAQKACKSAIKSGDKLTLEEINALMESLKRNWGLKCPHGRPVAIKISRTEIDKWFKRIV